MATYTDNTKKTERKVLSINEEDMLQDAKTYAKTEFSSIKILLNNLGITIEEADLAKAWIKVKYDQIVESRTNRVTFFD